MTSSKVFSGIKVFLLLVVFLAIMNLSIGEQRFCGDNLRDVLDLMCPDGFNKHKTKRSSLPLDEELSSIEAATDDDFNFGLSLDMLPFLTSMENSESGIAKLRRRRHGVAHECCDKPCTMKEVMSYCKA